MHVLQSTYIYTVLTEDASAPVTPRVREVGISGSLSIFIDTYVLTAEQSNSDPIQELNTSTYMYM